MKECGWAWQGSNLQLPDHQSDGHLTETPKLTGKLCRTRSGSTLFAQANLYKYLG